MRLASPFRPARFFGYLLMVSGPLAFIGMVALTLMGMSSARATGKLSPAFELFVSLSPLPLVACLIAVALGVALLAYDSKSRSNAKAGKAEQGC